MLDKLNELSESHGALKPGRGILTGVIALTLGILCLLGVLAFHFPEYLTTPELRRSYDVALMRQLLFWSMVVAGGVSLANIAFNRARWLSAFAFLFAGWLLAAALGAEAFACLMAILASLPGRIVLALGLAAFWYHFFAGLRHLAWDAGFGFRKTTARRSGRVVVLLAALAFIATVLLTPAGRFLAGAP